MTVRGRGGRETHRQVRMTEGERERGGEKDAIERWTHWDKQEADEPALESAHVDQSPN